jgi:hypothetical protein
MRPNDGNMRWINPLCQLLFIFIFSKFIFSKFARKGIDLLTRVASIFASIFHRQLLFGNSKFRRFEVSNFSHCHRLLKYGNTPSSCWFRRQCHFLVIVEQDYHHIHDNVERMFNVDLRVMSSSSSSAAVNKTSLVFREGTRTIALSWWTGVVLEPPYSFSSRAWSKFGWDLFSSRANKVRS